MPAGVARRRVWSIDVHSPGDGSRSVRARGRDLDLADGTATVVDGVAIEADLDHDGCLARIESEGADLSALRGERVRSGFRATVADRLPSHHQARTLLHALLDDLPGAVLVSGYGDLRRAESIALPPDRADLMADICAGWAREATMLKLVGQTGLVPVPGVATAPRLQGFGEGCFENEPDLVAMDSRRARLVEVRPDAEGHAVSEWYRDSHLPDDGEGEVVVHEYDVTARLSADLTVEICEATARVLPWPECPRALNSAARAVGTQAGDLRPLVKSDFSGVSTCTHLNDAVRFLDEVVPLVAGAASSSSD